MGIEPFEKGFSGSGDEEEESDFVGFECEVGESFLDGLGFLHEEVVGEDAAAQ